MQSIEIYAPNRDQNGNFLGLNHEAIFSGPEVLVEPIRIVRDFEKQSGFEEGDPYVFVDCIQAIFPIKGLATSVAPGAVFEYGYPTYTGARGRRSGKNTGSKAWRRRRETTSSASSSGKKGSDPFSRGKWGLTPFSDHFPRTDDHARVTAAGLPGALPGTAGSALIHTYFKHLLTSIRARADGQ